jgi:hypothetical protein
MNSHLARVHGVTKAGRFGSSSALGLTTASTLPLRLAFARGAQQLHFNLDLFNAILIQWVYINNISFRVVQQPTFRLILGYLMACVSLSFLSQYLCTGWAFKY